MSGLDPAAKAFYDQHRGGAGAVIVAECFCGDKQRTAVFSSIEAAMAFSDLLGDGWACAFCPFVVDEPDFGNAAVQ